MQPYWEPDWDTIYLDATGALALFFGIASVVISLSEPLLTARPFDPLLLGFGGVCLFVSWVALEITVGRSVGRRIRPMW